MPGFFARTLAAPEAEGRIASQHARRDRAFLRILERGVYARPESPYRKLLAHARIALEDVARLVEGSGLEGALSRLYDAGVYLTLPEFKGRRPIARPGGLEIASTWRDFDNPLLRSHYEGRTSGSRGVGTRVLIDLDLLGHEAAYYHRVMDAFGLGRDRPIGLWRAVPPVASGLKAVLRYGKIGRAVERWFTPSRFGGEGFGDLKFALLTRYTILVGRLGGRRLAYPEFTPKEQASKVARWLARKRAEGRPALLDASASAGVRACLAAREEGLDIAGTFFRFGGEPLTAAKARAVADAGGRVCCHYSMAEVGLLGVACGDPSDLDDVHLVTDKVAAIQREKEVGGSGLRVPALIYTTLHPSCPKLMLNVESDDYAVVEERTCGCPLGRLGLSTHLRRIRSYEKLTSEGVTFIGSDLVSLLEEVLPGRFGGHPTDYQLVEEENGAGIPRVSILVSPRVGRVDEAAVVAAVRAALRAHPDGGAEMDDQWRQGGTLRVERRDPHATISAKILPLHILSQATGR